MDDASAFSVLKSRIEDKTAVVGVMGLGYVGLPLVDAFIQAGFRAIGFDIDPMKVAHLNAGESYIAHIASERIRDWRAQERFVATSDQARLQDADAILICVPTPLTANREPDLGYVKETGRQIASHLRRGQLIVLESTTYPGTTRDVLLPILAETGLKVGEDFFLAYSPEREDPGNPQFRARNIPKVVGGYDEPSRELATTLYRQAVVEVVAVSNCQVAEACKILENTYRAVNIALVNELKLLYDRMGIDVWEVIDAAKTKPFGFQAFYPGPGLGGHCIPIDPFYLAWAARKYNTSARFIELAGEVNAAMPHHVIERVADALNEHCKPLRGSKVLVLGMAYKKDVDDARESPGFELLELLLQKGAHVCYNDPYIPSLPKTRHYPTLRIESTPLSSQMLSQQDCVLVATNHSAYDFAWIAKHARLVVDTRNAMKGVPFGTGTVWKA